MVTNSNLTFDIFLFWFCILKTVFAVWAERLIFAATWIHSCFFKNCFFIHKIFEPMFFDLSEEHLAVRDAARDFAQKDLKPGVIERDSKMIYPTEQVKMMGELGFLGMMVSPEYGGGGMDTLSYVLAMEEISKVDSSCSVIMSVNNSLVCWGIEAFGTEEQKRKYLPKLVTGEWLGSFCLSEPEAGDRKSVV